MPAKQPTVLIAPTSRAFGRMTTILFRPFDLGKWCVLGFTAFLATLLEGSSSSSFDFGNPSFDPEAQEEGLEELSDIEGLKDWGLEMWEETLVFLEENPWVLPTAISVIVAVFVVVTILTWLMARGKFMFLDNIVHNRALVVNPWREFRREGNSLFWWIFLFGLFTSVFSLALITGAGYWVFQNREIFEGENFFTTEVITAASIGAGVLLILSVCSIMIYTLQNQVVIPQMYQHRIGVLEAWVRALRLFRQRFWGFIGFMLWTVVLNLAAAVVILVVGLLTCCIGAILVGLPYIGAVLTLPITVFFCALGPEFLRQFGEEYDIWAGDTDHYKMVPPATEHG